MRTGMWVHMIAIRVQATAVYRVHVARLARLYTTALVWGTEVRFERARVSMCRTELTMRAASLIRHYVSACDHQWPSVAVRARTETDGRTDGDGRRRTPLHPLALTRTLWHTVHRQFNPAHGHASAFDTNLMTVLEMVLADTGYIWRR